MATTATTATTAKTPAATTVKSTRKTRTFKYEGKEISMAALSRATKIGYTTLYARIIEQKMTVADAIKGPKLKSVKPKAFGAAKFL